MANDFCNCDGQACLCLILFCRRMLWGAWYLNRCVIGLCGFYYIRTKGKRASKQEAPTLVGAPHSSFFDGLLPIIFIPCSVVTRSENVNVPIFSGTHSVETALSLSLSPSLPPSLSLFSLSLSLSLSLSIYLSHSCACCLCKFGIPYISQQAGIVRYGRASYTLDLKKKMAQRMHIAV